MNLIFFFLLSTSLSETIQLPNRMADVAKIFQGFCNREIESRSILTSDHRDLIKSYLCGAELPLGETKNLFANSGIYHIIVVSGSHLVLLMTVLRYFFTQDNPLSLILFLGYSLLTGFQPPIVRALCMQLLGTLSRAQKLSWLPSQTLVISGLWVISLNPDWIHSLAFQLSFAASLAMRIGNTLFPKRPILSAIITYCSLLPFLLGWAQIHPLSILTNLMLAPVLALFLWGACFCWLISPAFGEALLCPVLNGLSSLNLVMPIVRLEITLSEPIRWTLIILLCATLWIVGIQTRRPQ